MKRRASLPEVPTQSLRDHGNPERIDRIWRRLESDLSTGPARPRAVLWWAPAAVLIVFGSGVVVGARWGRSDALPPAVVEAEPRGTLEEPSGPGPDLPEPVAPAPQEERDPEKQRRMPVHPVEAPEAPVLPEIVEPMTPLTSAAPVSAPPEWTVLAEKGMYKEARAALERAGGFDLALASATADQLMTLAEVARATGQSGQAIRALRRVVDQFSSDPNAPIAAYTLGTLLEKSGDKAGASKAFEAYRRLSPKGDFAEDALARQVEVAIEQGNVELARQLADQYAKDFPKGRRLSEIRAQIAKLTGEPAQPKSSASSAPRTEDEAPSEETEEPAAPASE